MAFWSKKHKLTDEECPCKHYAHDHTKLPPCRKCEECGEWVRPEDEGKPCKDYDPVCR